MIGFKKAVTLVFMASFGLLALVSADQVETQFDSVPVPYTASQTVNENRRVAAKAKNHWVNSHPQYEFISSEPTYYLVRGMGGEGISGNLGISGYIITYKARPLPNISIDSSFKFVAEPLSLSVR